MPTPPSSVKEKGHRPILSAGGPWPPWNAAASLSTWTVSSSRWPCRRWRASRHRHGRAGGDLGVVRPGADGGDPDRLPRAPGGGRRPGAGQRDGRDHRPLSEAGAAQGDGRQRLDPGAGPGHGAGARRPADQPVRLALPVPGDPDGEPGRADPQPADPQGPPPQPGPHRHGLDRCRAGGGGHQRAVPGDRAALPGRAEAGQPRDPAGRRGRPGPVRGGGAAPAAAAADAQPVPVAGLHLRLGGGRLLLRRGGVLLLPAAALRAAGAGARR